VSKECCIDRIQNEIVS